MTRHRKYVEAWKLCFRSIVVRQLLNILKSLKNPAEVAIINVYGYLAYTYSGSVGMFEVHVSIEGSVCTRDGVSTPVHRLYVKMDNTSLLPPFFQKIKPKCPGYNIGARDRSIAFPGWSCSTEVPPIDWLDQVNPSYFWLFTLFHVPFANLEGLASLNREQKKRMWLLPGDRIDLICIHLTNVSGCQLDTLNKALTKLMLVDLVFKPASFSW